MNFANYGNDCIFYKRYIFKQSLKYGKNQVEFVEKFQSTEGWLPGETILKEPYLKGGGKTDVILSGITLKTSASNVKTRVDYSDLIYTLDFHAESVVVNEKEIPDSWNVSVTIQGDDVTWTAK